MKKSKYLLVLLLVCLFAIPMKTDALINLGRDTDRFVAIKNKIDASFTDAEMYGLRDALYVKWLQEADRSQDPFVVYCSDYGPGYRSVTDFYDADTADIGVQYIIKNGFTGKEHAGESYHYLRPQKENCTQSSCPAIENLTTNAPRVNQPWYVNYILTQIAIWGYLDDGSHDDLANLRDRLNSADLTENEKAIKSLIDGAKAVKNSDVNFTNPDPKLVTTNTEMKQDGGYYYSELIGVTGVAFQYTISVDKNIYEVVDANKNAKTTFNENEKFYVRVLKTKLTESDSVTLTISTTGKTFASKYVSPVGSQTVSGYKEKTVNTKTSTLKLNVTVVKACDLKVTVIDSVSKEKICGGSFVIVDENGNPAKNSSGEEVGTITLSQDKCDFSVSLPHGKYTVEQKTAIEPYLIDEVKYQFNLETQCPLNVELVNEKLYRIKVLKINGSEENPLAGAKLKLEDSNGNLVKEFVSTTEEIVIDKLHAGTYYLSEISAPSGYALNGEKITIEVNNTNDGKLFTFNNDEIIVPKTDFNSKIIIFGLVLGLIGVGFIYYSKKKYA